MMAASKTTKSTKILIRESFRVYGILLCTYNKSSIAMLVTKWYFSKVNKNKSLVTYNKPNVAAAIHV